MNEGFFTLEKEKQDKIINAGFEVFSQSPYKKAPVAEIASKAGISKSLLFYHFKNKKALYLFLWERSIEITRKALTEWNVLGTDDFFEMLRRSLYGKCDLMVSYPYVSEFSLRAYYEEDSSVKETIQKSFAELNADSERKAFEKVDLTCFREDIVLHDMYREMVWASDGYLHMALMKGEVDVDELKETFEGLIAMWEKVYLK